MAKTAFWSIVVVLSTLPAHAQQPPEWTPPPTFKAAPYEIQRKQPGDYQAVQRELERAEQQAIRDMSAVLRQMARKKALEITR